MAPPPVVEETPTPPVQETNPSSTQNQGNANTQNSGVSQQGNNTKSSNTNLKSLSLNIEGLSPAFNKNTTLYNLIIDSSIENIDVLASSEDSTASVSVYGNEKLAIGINKIEIIVTAQNGNKKTYNINVTKTENKELANASLENLAVENFMLTPEFEKDITEYTLEVGSDIQNLNILAVPQREQAGAVVEGFENLQFGENLVTITVTAEDTITRKIYTINVHKKTVEEEEQEILDAQALNAQPVLADNEGIKIWGILFIVLVTIIVAIVIGWAIAEYKKSNKKDL